MWPSVDIEPNSLIYKLFSNLSCIDSAASADLAVVLMQEGLGQIFLVGRR